MQQRRLSRIIESEEEQLGVLVQQAQGGEDVVDWQQSGHISTGRSLLFSPRTVHVRLVPVDTA